MGFVITTDEIFLLSCLSKLSKMHSKVWGGEYFNIQLDRWEKGTHNRGPSCGEGAKMIPGVCGELQHLN